VGGLEMTREDIREEIKEGLRKILPKYARRVDEIADLGLTHSETRAEWGALLEETIKGIQEMEASNGVVLKVEGELPTALNEYWSPSSSEYHAFQKAVESMLEAGYTKTIPLVEEK